MRASLPSIALSLALLSVLGAVLPVGQAARADESRVETFAYRLYLAGLKIGKANVTATITDDSYTVTGSAKTIGVLGWFGKVEGQAHVTGRRVGGSLLAPEIFEVSAVTDGSEKLEMRMPFEGDAPSAVEADPPFRKVDYAVEPKAQRGALDPLTALIAALLPIHSDAPCDRTISVFDGRRRFDIAIDAPRNSYEKKGKQHVECAARYVRVGGFKQKHMKKPDIDFTVDFALTGGVAKPARVVHYSYLGPVVATLQKY